MSKDRTIELIIFSLFGGGALVSAGMKRYFLTRKTQDTATSKIAFAAQGFVELEGYAWPASDRKTINSLAGRGTVFYKVLLQKYVRRGKNSHWETLGEFSIDHPFHILDETGTILVDPRDFELHVQKNTIAWKNLSVVKRKQICDWMASSVSNLPPLEPGFFSGSYRCLENYILIGSPVLIHGQLISSQQSQKIINDSKMRNFFDMITRFKKGGARSKSLLDVDGDGILSESEARIGIHSAATVSLRKNQETDSTIPFCGVIRPHDQHSSFLADCHQEHFLQKVGSWNLLMIFGGASLIIAAIGYAFYKLHIQI